MFFNMFCDAYRDILVTVLRLFRKDVALKLSSSACSLSLVSAELLSEEAPHAASLGGATFISLPSKRVLPREAKFESTAGVCLLIPSCDFVSPLSRSRRPSGASEPSCPIDDVDFFRRENDALKNPKPLLLTEPSSPDFLSSISGTVLSPEDSTFGSSDISPDGD